MTRKTVRERFIDFHRENPDIYTLFDHFTREALATGMKRVGAKFVFERIRWEIYVGTKRAGYCAASKRLLKLNNDFTPWYARLFMAKNREYLGVFELRVTKSK